MEPVEVLEAAIPVAPDPPLSPAEIVGRMRLPAFALHEVMAMLDDWHTGGMLERAFGADSVLYRWGKDGPLRPDFEQTQSGLALQRAWLKGSP